jgi:[CysO sulfur-carrier protein]-S-L-cysteine hydrolase
MENAAHSPLRFEVDPREVMQVLEAIDEAGLEVAALYHSHTRTAPYPSQTDVTFAEAWPGTPWIIVGLDGDEAEIRTYLIEGPDVTEL